MTYEKSVVSTWKPLFTCIERNLKNFSGLKKYHLCVLGLPLNLKIWLFLQNIDPRGRPTVTTGSEHCFCTCHPFVHASVRPSPLFKTKQNSSENNVRCWLDCGSGRVDHLWHTSCSPLFLADQHTLLSQNIISRKEVFSSLVFLGFPLCFLVSREHCLKSIGLY